MKILSEENRKGYVTFQNQVYMGGYLFGINTQAEFNQVLFLEVGCGCNGTAKKSVKHYAIKADKNIFYIDAKDVVETSVAIPLESQDFDNVRRNVFLNPGKDFSEINNPNSPAKIWEQANRSAIDNYKH